LKRHQGFNFRRKGAWDSNEGNPMRHHISKASLHFAASALALCIAAPALAEETAEGNDAVGEIVVTGRVTTYNNNAVTEPMLRQQTPITSPLAAIDNLPGVNVQEGDTFGFDDWSTSVSIRGFQTNLGTQEIGMTIDGLPNGGSNYGGGSKANRYIDTMNIGGVVVNQGTADIGSLSNEALGGTIDFLTDDPLRERRVRFSGTAGEFDAMRFYARYDTGDLGGVRAWISASHQEATDHVTQTAQNERDHVAAKFTTDGLVRITGYASYDDTHEDNYDQVYSLEQYEANPNSDGLTGEWLGIPFIDQVYRRAWSTLRENVFTYLKAEVELGGIDLRAAGYYHRQKGRGDWVPNYIVNVTDDGDGNPESELVGNGTVNGGPALGRYVYVDGNGVALAPADGCEATFTFPYGGTTDGLYDPACYPAGAVPVQSYRHTHYKRDRYGFTGDAAWEADLGPVINTLRGGLWYEGGTRSEWRDWHQLIDARVGPDFEETPYWVQYDRKYPQSTFKWFIEDSVAFGPVTVTGGIKQFQNDLERNDQFGQSADTTLDTKSDVLLSAGVRFDVTPDLNVFGGFAENYKALTDAVLENTGADFSRLEPETSENWEGGLRYNNGRIQASATYFKSKFDNRIIFISPGSETGPDYLEGENGTYFNGGGIDSEGFELLAAARITDTLSVLGTYTYIDATYRGTGDPLVDEAQGVTPGNRVTGIPKNMFVLSADYENELFRAGVSTKYTGERWVNLANTFPADDYMTVDAYIGVRGEAISDMFKAVDLTLVVNNALDADYLGGISGNAAWIGAPRTVTFTATLDF
jgi:hypothetical protein